jgi:hypothetical protein
MEDAIGCVKGHKFRQAAEPCATLGDAEPTFREGQPSARADRNTPSLWKAIFL